MVALIAKHGLYFCQLDQCQVGLRDRESGLPHQKPTVIITNCSELAEQASLRCSRDHAHQQLVGTNRYGSRTSQAENYPLPMAQKIARTVMKQAHG